MTDLPNPLSHAYLLTGGSGESRAALSRDMASLASKKASGSW